LSISREKSRMNWGIDVPSDPCHVMYVWFDALTNYISTLGWPEDKEGTFSRFWAEGDTLQLAGKDQIRFQSIIWQAMLKSAGVRATDKIFYHGFITSGGHKMSKSIGNVIDPYALVERYGTDATRYIMLRHVHPTDDSDLTWEKMDEWYTANLVNGLGNLTARIMKMAETHLDNPVAYESLVQLVQTGGCSDFVHEAISGDDFQRALDEIWRLVGIIDLQITNEEPFKVVKTDLEKGRNMIKEYLYNLGRIGVLLQSFMPQTAEIILKAIKENKKPENLFKRLES
jgi:methionyl-tRNA synthetase